MSKLKTIQAKPTTLENIHESCFRSYDILEQVLIMVERGDTKETIFEVVDFLKCYPVDTEFAKEENKEQEQCTIQNVMSFGYEYFMEVDGVMKKVADSKMLTLAQENEEMYAKRFREDIVNGKIKGHIQHCS